jgi:hypothetical protein
MGGADVCRRLAIFDERDAAVRLQRAFECGEHRLRLLKLVIDIDHQDPVELSFRQFRICFAAEDRDDVGESLVGGFVFQDFEHLRLNVVRVDDTVRRDGSCQATRVEAGTGADIRDDIAVAESHRVDDDVRPFLLGARRPLEPRRAGRRDDVGRLPLTFRHLRGRCVTGDEREEDSEAGYHGRRS